MKKKRWIAFWICLLIAALALGYVVYYYAVRSRNEAIYQQAQSAVSSTPAESSSGSSAVQPQADTSELSVDFNALWAVNSDIYAWIDIPDTDISYPIAQSATDDSYYLNYTIEGIKGYPGSIYTESCDAKDFSDFNTVIYGHNMKDGSMFGSLKQYRDENFLDNHRQIVIYTPTENRVYQIFAAIIADDTYIPGKYDDNIVEDRQAFLDSIYNNRNLNSHVLDDVSVSTDSQILTLSTCVGKQPNNRYLIEAVYVGDS